MSYADFAASVQKSLEDVLIDFVLELKEVTKMDNLVISGGVALNCSANGKIEKSKIFKIFSCISGKQVLVYISSAQILCMSAPVKLQI